MTGGNGFSRLIDRFNPTRYPATGWNTIEGDALDESARAMWVEIDWEIPHRDAAVGT